MLAGRRCGWPLGGQRGGRWLGECSRGDGSGHPGLGQRRAGDVVVSLLDGVELMCAPPDLFLIPERGSAVEASLAEEVELAWASTELCTTPDVEPDEEAAAEADESVDDVGSVDDVLAADSDDGLEADDDESDDEREELVSVGSANATPGVVATAPPTPSANANTPARIMCCAVTGIALRGQSARAPARWDPAVVKVILATFLVDAVGLRCRLLMARWCPLCTRPRGQLSGSGWRGCPAGRLFPGGNVAASPKGPQAAPGSDSVDRLGPPPPSTVFVGVPAQWMEFGAKGRGRPAAVKGSAGWVTTVTGDADHVTFSGISVPAWGKP